MSRLPLPVITSTGVEKIRLTSNFLKIIHPSTTEPSFDDATGMFGDVEVDDSFMLPESPLEKEQKLVDGDFYLRFRDLRDGAYIYFRGYINGITENLSPSWGSTNYIGRSEPVYNYERAERDISFNLAVYPQSARQQATMYRKMDRLTSMVYPNYMPDKDSLTRMKPPFTEMYMAQIGTKTKGQFGYIKSLSYTVNESGDWDALQALPRVFNIAISYQIVHKKPPALYTTTFYGANSLGDL